MPLTYQSYQKLYANSQQQPVKFKAYQHDISLRVDALIKLYFDKTVALRHDIDFMFSSRTLVRWVSDILHKTFISNHLRIILSVQHWHQMLSVVIYAITKIAKAAGWTNIKTLGKFYKKPVIDNNFDNFLLTNPYNFMHIFRYCVHRHCHFVSFHFWDVQQLFVFWFVRIQKQPLEIIYKKAVFRNFAIFTRKHLCWSLFSWPTTLSKRDYIKQVFSCKYCKIFKNIYFEEHPPTAASKNHKSDMTPSQISYVSVSDNKINANIRWLYIKIFKSIACFTLEIWWIKRPIKYSKARLVMATLK